MKRFWIPLFALLALASSVPSSAGEWVTKEIKWQLTYQGGASGTDITTRDTTFNVIAGGQTDTTGVFSIQGAVPFLSKTATVTTNSDTTVVAFLLFAPDSLGVTAPSVSSITVEIDGGIRGMRGNSLLSSFAQIDSVVAAGNSIRGVVSVPIRAIGSLSNPALTTFQYNREYGMLAWPDLRARITAATGVMSAARAYVRYWSEK